MSEHSKIQWTETSWNPVLGCSKVSPGCANCYAVRQVQRMSGNPNAKIRAANEGLTGRKGNGALDWTGVVRLIPERLAQPLKWKKPRRVFVNSLSDLFHESLSNEDIAAVFGVMAAAPKHTFQLLTKRANRMEEWFRWAGHFEIPGGGIGPLAAIWQSLACSDIDVPQRDLNRWDLDGPPVGDSWPLPNVWLGVSVENQEQADERIPHLLNTPAAVRFLSCEPLLGRLHLDPWIGGAETVARCCLRCGFEPIEGMAEFMAIHGAEATCIRCGDALPNRQLDWVIVGGESGPGARPCDVAWIGSLVEQCRDAKVACFVKQLGGNSGVWWGKKGSGDEFFDRTPNVDRKGGNITEWPAHMRVRQFPEVRA